MCLQYSSATYGLFSDYSGSSLLDKSHSDWTPLGRSYNKYSSPYLSVFDTLNSEYSHAIYPIGHHLLRIPVKGGLTVVRAPNFGSYKGISSYGDYSGLKYTPSLKTTPLNNYYSSHIIRPADLYRFARTHSLTSGGSLKSRPISTYSIKQLSHSPISLRDHSLHENTKSLHGTHGISISTPISKSYASPIISSHDDSSGLSHNIHELSHSQQSDIGHDLTHTHLSDIGQELSSIHDSDIGHGLTSIHDSDISDQHHPATFSHSSSHSVLHDDDVDDDSDHVIDGGVDDGHYSSLHKSHLSDDQDSYLNGEVIGHSDKHLGHLVKSHDAIDDISEGEKGHYHKDSGKQYTSQEHIEEHSRDVKDDKYNQKPLRLPHKEDVKISSHSYVEQKKADYGRVHAHKDNYNNYQEDKHKNKAHHIKSFGKPLTLTKVPLHRPAKPYPQFPLAPKHDSYDVVKYSGGRHPVRPAHDHLEQTYFNPEPKHSDHGADKHASYDVQQKIEQQEQLHDDDYKPSDESSYKSGEYRKPQSYVQNSKEHNYKSHNVQPRGRTKVYRNYENPRQSSYEIEILHSDSSDQKLDGVENSDANSEESNKEVSEAVLSENPADEYGAFAFDTEESRQITTEEKSEDSKPLPNSEKEE
ncbi:hypothetical protein JTE90_014781 [Oedothorax gibbosus]|uniref:Uncharacterized protein n=1 Tax=Oedothorax gibbosus TaxID=931172 RepID=A0AAV6UAB2_9ARAC|nr:hypothetical protein JTE90_014781 [Oedothorax gibbosus]